MVTTIKVVIKFDHEPSTEYLDSYVDCMMELVDDYCNHRPRSFHLEPPKPEQIVTRDFVYRWIIDVCNASAHAEELFKLINDIPCEGKLLLVNVLDHEYDIVHKANVGYYWTNDGETWYHDSERPYVDAYFDFHVNDYQDYSIVHIPTYIQRMSPSDRARYEKSGATFMWRCTACWDNFMKATTLEEAKSIYTKRHGFRKNKKGLTVEYIPYRMATRIKKIKNQIVTEKQDHYLGGYMYEVYKDVAHYYCSNCKHELKNANQQYCPCCDAELFEEEEE